MEAGCGRVNSSKVSRIWASMSKESICQKRHKCLSKTSPCLPPISKEVFQRGYLRCCLFQIAAGAFFQPERYLQEAFRVLKPGSFDHLVPDWETNYKIHYDDYTHRTPFSLYALRDIYKIFLFENVNVWKFRQLPIVWRYPAMNYLCAIIAPFVPVRTKIKFLKWSRELMLCGSGNKPFSVTR